jgi:hypothetical protein
MSLTTIGSIPSRHRKRIKGQYVSAVAGVAFAITAAVTFAPGDTASKTIASSHSAFVPAVTRGDVAPHWTFYIVANEAERVALLEQIERESHNSPYEGWDPQAQQVVLVTGTPAAQAFLGEGVRELSAVGATFDLVDTTQKGTSGDVDRQLTDADALSSALSSEMAMHDFRSLDDLSGLQVAAERAALTSQQEQAR